MQRIVAFLFLLLFSLVPQIASAKLPAATTPMAVPAAQLSVLKTDAAAMKGALAKPELTNLRFAVHNDAVTGASRLRVVIDVTGPVKVDASVSASPAPQLTVNIKGAGTGTASDCLQLDGQIAQQATLSAVEDNSQVLIDLPNMIDNNDYRVFTLPQDIKANKPFRVVIDINKPVQSANIKFTPGLSGKVIALDPGHGGTDSGAIGPAQVQEKTVTLAVAQKVQALLERAGAKVLMTRSDDRDVFAPNDSAVDELRARAQVGNSNKADIFVSIHANSFTSPAVGGTSTYYYPKSAYDRTLAQSLQDCIVQTDGLDDRGINQANFYVVKHTMMPAALIEMAFISNPKEEKLLTMQQFQQKMAQGIVQGLERFFAQASRMGGGQ
ncbi:MAG: N-acetylmuramoyl-L-alanine amidase [Veillonellales bacterium]